MCKCKDIQIGELTNQIILNYDGKTYSIDKCLAEEIKYLWEKGIKTTGCCCGHNKLLPFIGVAQEDTDKMIELGYDIQVNVSGLDNVLRTDTFYPKTVRYNKYMFENNMVHLIKTTLQEVYYELYNL